MLPSSNPPVDDFFTLTRHTSQNEAEIFSHGKLFAESVNLKKLEDNYDDELVWNTDQSGFNYEMVGNRTLSDKGEKTTRGLVQSLNSMTHSYTVQIMVSNAGFLAKKAYICFQERGGKFGPIVMNRIRDKIPPNVQIDCTDSGKMTKKTLENWIQSCLGPEIEHKCLLVLDSWPAQKDNTFFNRCLPQEKQVELMVIPPGATQYVQPLDVYFFRQFKLVVRRLTDYIRCEIDDEGAQRKLNDRLFLMNMISFVYGQFKSPKFRNMLLYAWQKSGYTVQEQIDSFDNAITVLFKNNCINSACASGGCDQDAIIACSFCDKPFCAIHCIIPKPHLHH